MHSIITPDAKLKKLWDSGKHTEGPVYFPEDDSVIFSDVSGDCLYRWTVTNGISIIHHSACYYHNGNTRDGTGRLISCSHGKRAIVRREHNGEWQIICDRYQGNRMNYPILL